MHLHRISFRLFSYSLSFYLYIELRSFSENNDVSLWVENLQTVSKLNQTNDWFCVECKTWVRVATRI